MVVCMRGFSLGRAGDIYIDGMKDAPLIERDTFNQGRVEVLNLLRMWADA
ncbi:hypothetical protein [Acidovorax sp.]